ncbi:MAG: hypothetical protein ACTJG2_03800 [Candidatus Saccharimonadales bacterium]
MNYNQLSAKLNTEQSPENRDIVISFLQHCSTALKADTAQSSEIAHSITGLMATDYTKTLPENDPINTVLTIAGELEIDDPKDRDILKDELIDAIDQLQR